MKFKLSSFILVLLALVVLISSASAVSFANTASSLVTPANATHNAGSFQMTFQLNNTDAFAGPVTLDKSILGISGSSLTFSPASGFTLNSGENRTVTATLSYPSFQSGTISGSLTASNSTGSTQAFSFNVPILPAKTFSLTKLVETSKTQNGTMRVDNTGNTNLNLALSASGAFNASFYDGSALLPSVSVPAGQSKTLTVSPIISSLSFGSNGATVVANDSANGVQQTLGFAIAEGFCSPAAIGTNLTVTDVNIQNQGSGDDNSWTLLDTLSVEVRVDNRGLTDLDDIIVQFGLIDNLGRDVSNKLEFTNKDERKIKISRLHDGDDVTVQFEFKVPGDFNTGSYKLVFKAYSRQVGENLLCTDSVSSNVLENIVVDQETDSGKFIGFDNINVSPDQATCGDSVSVGFDAVNVGEENQDKVKVYLVSRELGVNQETEIKQGLDRGDKQALTYNFIVPSGLQDKTYSLELSADYDYNNGVYRQNLDSTNNVALKVFGCTPSTNRVANIAASLDSDAVAGKPLDVSINVQNTNTQAVTYSLDVIGYSDWASLGVLSDREFTLNAGQTKTITLTLNPKSDASGEKSFTVQLRSGDKVQSQEVAVSFAGEASNLSNIFSENKVAWIIGLVNVVLIILIIIVAVKVSRN